MAGTKRAKRGALGLLAVAIAFGPMALVVGAQDDEIDLYIDPPAELSDFSPGGPLLTDAHAQEIATVLPLDQLIELLGLGDLPDADGDGIPDTPEGEPGDLDLPPGARDIQIDANGTVTLGPDVELADASVEAVADVDSFLQGQCAGLAVSYGPDGDVLDAAVGIGGARDGALVLPVRG